MQRRDTLIALLALGTAPPACPRAATLASAPAPKYNDKRAEQPVATENRRLTRPTDSPTLRLACLKWLSLESWFAGVRTCGFCDGVHLRQSCTKNGQSCCQFCG